MSINLVIIIELEILIELIILFRNFDNIDINFLENNYNLF